MHDENRARLSKQAAIFKKLEVVRPSILASPIRHAMRDRAIVDIEGLRIFLSPSSHLGRTILAEGTYEAETIAIFRQRITPGSRVLDIGANEGFFSSMASMLAGRDGLVVAVEPQSRLSDILEINLALNSSSRTVIVRRAIAEADNLVLKMSLWPTSNNGASGLVNQYRWGGSTEDVKSITPATILKEVGGSGFDFVKIDVEGFEPEVIRALLPLAKEGRVKAVLLDYHTRILRTRGLSAEDTHKAMLASGFTGVGDLDGYVLYDHVRAGSA